MWSLRVGPDWAGIGTHIAALYGPNSAQLVAGTVGSCEDKVRSWSGSSGDSCIRRSRDHGVCTSRTTVTVCRGGNVICQELLPYVIRRLINNGDRRGEPEVSELVTNPTVLVLPLDIIQDCFIMNTDVQHMP